MEEGKGQAGRQAGCFMPPHEAGLWPPQPHDPRPPPPPMTHAGREASRGLRPRGCEGLSNLGELQVVGLGRVRVEGFLFMA